MALIDVQQLVDLLARDDTGKITTGDRDTAIGRAVARYGRDRPRRPVQDLTAAGGQTLALPSGWVADFSVLLALEHPVGTIPPQLLDARDWGLYTGPSGTVIQLRSALAAGAVVRATYTAPHTLDAATDTIPDGDREAVASYAAALLLDQLAALYSGDSDSTIQADVVDHQGKGDQFAARARALRRRYFDELGIDPKRTVAAGAVVNLQLPDSQGRDRLTHPERWR